MSFPLSVVILTQDEEINVRDCLESVAWADDVILVDSGSTDGTIARAREARPGVRVFTHPFKDFGDQRNWALDNTQPRHEWILFVDADERITPACALAIQSAIRNPALHRAEGSGAGPQSEIQPVGFFLSSRSFFMGRWIKHCTLYPSWQLRLLKAGRVRFQKEGHGQREVADGPLGYIAEPYDHYGFSKGLEHWRARHERYAAEEVELILRLRAEPLTSGDLFRDPIARRRCLKRLAARVGCRPLLRCLYLYILRRGFLDGRAGLEFCRLRVAHERNITARLRKARQRDSL